MSSVLDPAYQYWKNTVSQEDSITCIPLEKPVNSEKEYDELHFQLHSSERDTLFKIAGNSPKNMFAMLLSMLSVCLKRYSLKEYIKVGIPKLKKEENLEDKVLAFQMKVDGNDTVREIVNSVREKYVSRCRYEEFNFDEEELAERVVASSSDILLVQMEGLHNLIATNKADCMLTFLIENGEIAGKVSFVKCKNNNEKIEQFIEILQNCAREVLVNRTASIKELKVVPEPIAYDLIEQKNANQADIQKKSVTYVIEKICNKFENRVAVEDKEKNITYRELWSESGKIAAYLQRQGIEYGDTVGILVTRTVDFVEAILGILRLGASFIPIDTSVPQGRIEYYLTNGNAKAVIVNQSCPIHKLLVISMQEIRAVKEEMKPADINNTEETIAYILYTSGSTGRPKGVKVKHSSILNLIYSLYQKFYCEYPEDTRIGLLTSFSFDPTIMQVFVSLLRGYTLNIIPEEVIGDGTLLISYLKEKRLSSMAGTPSHLRLLIDGNKHKEKGLPIKSIIVGGEQLGVKLLKEFNDTFSAATPQVINLYGPTETCVASTCYIVDMNELANRSSAPIGTPFSNTQIYIMDRNYNIMPKGTVGEVYIGGMGVAAGYVNNEEETNKRFIMNPFKQDEFMYRTGDLGKWLDDGNLQYVGRVDNQVKVRGYRIELEEIETILKEQEEVEDAAVLIDKSEENTQLIAFVVKRDKEQSEEVIKQKLVDVLPYYMIPNAIIPIETIPININGKVDKEKLLKNKVVHNQIEVPSNETEEALLAIWRELLKRDDFGVSDNFFSLGGHSLKLMKMTTMIYEKFQCDIPISKLLEHADIKWISQYILRNQENQLDHICASEKKTYYEMSATQKRMYISYKMDQTGTAYNTPMLLSIKGEIEEENFKEAVKKVVKRHEILRTVFVENENTMMQKVLDDMDVNIISQVVADDMENNIQNYIKPFDLEKGPLFRINLFRVNQEKSYLFIDMHHIITDLVSIKLFMEEVAKFYNGENLPEVKLQYRDFSEWQNEKIRTSRFEKLEQFWLNEFQDGFPVLDLPTDYKKPSLSSNQGKSLSILVNDQTTMQLRQLAEEQGVTMHMVVLSAYLLLLSKHAGREEVLIGIPVASRTQEEMNHILGAILNTVLFKIKVDSNSRYLEFLAKVKTQLMNVLENQEYPLDLLVDKLAKYHDINRGMIYEAAFNFYSEDANIEETLMKDIELTPVDLEYTVSHANIDMTCMELNDTLKLVINYSTEVYERETIEYFLKHFEEILSSIAQSSGALLKDLNMLTQEEKEDFFYGFGEL